jgi:hypothetical protein
MSSLWQYALSIGPLAVYLVLLARWHGGLHPRVVSGRADVALLTFGLGGLVLFGPFGQTMTGLLFGRPAPPGSAGWLALASGLTFVALLLSRRASRQLVVYHIDAASLERALLETLEDVPGRYVRTINGFEDHSRARGVRVEVSSRWLTATIDAFGREPDRLIRELEGRLRRRFRETSSPRSRLGWVFVAGSGATLLLPLVGRLLTQPAARAALRAFFERLPGV